jgi:hydroxyacylglutathione hydrolase
MSLYLKQLPLGPMENFVYLVGDTEVKQCVIVDPAWEIDRAWATAEKDEFTVVGALITHGHFDHCNAVEELLKKRNVPVYVNPKELDYLDQGAPRGLFLDLPKDQVKPVKSGDKLTLGNTSITFLHTPGHTPGSQCFLVNEQLMSGDTLFLGSCGRCDLPGSSPNDLYDSLNRVIGQLPPTTVLYPGHNYSAKGTKGTLSDEKKNNRFLTAHRLEDFLHLVGY